MKLSKDSERLLEVITVGVALTKGQWYQDLIGQIIEYHEQKALRIKEAL